MWRNSAVSGGISAPGVGLWVIFGNLRAFGGTSNETFQVGPDIPNVCRQTFQSFSGGDVGVSRETVSIVALSRTSRAVTDRWGDFGARLGSLRGVVAQRLMSPVDASGLAAFRVVFGLIVAWEAWRMLRDGWVQRYFSDRPMYFTYWPFDWVAPLPTDLMFLVVALVGIFAPVRRVWVVSPHQRRHAGGVANLYLPFGEGAVPQSLLPCVPVGLDTGGGSSQPMLVFGCLVQSGIARRNRSNMVIVVGAVSVGGPDGIRRVGQAQLGLAEGRADADVAERPRRLPVAGSVVR